jgi:hypothetical protein
MKKGIVQASSEIQRNEIHRKIAPTKVKAIRSSTPSAGRLRMSAIVGSRPCLSVHEAMTFSARFFSRFIVLFRKLNIDL